MHHSVVMDEPDSEEFVDTVNDPDSINMEVVEQPSIPSYLFQDEEGNDVEDEEDL